MIYFDYAATTPPYDDVINTVAEVMKRHYGNPSSIHQLGEDADKLLRRAREVCASALQIKPSEVVFTSGATESNNFAIKGAAFQYRSRGNHIITTEIEHASVYESFLQLKELGYDVTFLPVDRDGNVSPAQVGAAIQDNTILVSVMHVNNEVGTIQPIREIGQIIKQKHPRVLFHVDGVQGFGKIPVRIKDWGIDLYSLSAHKIRGPKGVGILYVHEGVKLFPLLSGGGQERGLRSGTENIANIVGMSKALRIAHEKQSENYNKWTEFRDLIVDAIEKIPQLQLNSTKKGTPNIIHFSYPGMKSEVLLHTLEQEGVAVSTRSACSSKHTEPSRVLLAMGRDLAAASSGIRISLGDDHTLQNVEVLIKALNAAVEKLRPLERGK
ncbi:cysteine desulfurase family protein [Paenibacillus sediminis]|uniref:Cysteine desulfurase n=1 Tax=Paenibacillus sediminis TaxID=664909 RepID=A0ABS4GYX0_9BACL|nr:cysteine desulfurase family protein [Paenibacillus sediminis]MBP1935421.1 cysteine desulfurase [Paenibacillus sediminis]